MRKIMKIARYIDNLNEAVGKTTCYLILFVTFVVLYEVMMRYVLNLSMTWGAELSQFLFSTAFLLGGAYTLLHHGHVRMDALYARFSKRTKAFIDVFTFVFFLIFILVLIWKGWESGWRAYRLSERTESAWAPLLWPVKMMVPLGAVLLLLQGVAHLIRNINTILGREEQDEY